MAQPVWDEDKGAWANAAAVANIATPASASAEDCANKINAVLAALRDAGVIAAD